MKKKLKSREKKIPFVVVASKNIRTEVILAAMTMANIFSSYNDGKSENKTHFKRNYALDDNDVHLF